MGELTGKPGCDGVKGRHWQTKCQTDHVPPGHYLPYTHFFPTGDFKMFPPKPIAVLFTAANALPSLPTPEDRDSPKSIPAPSPESGGYLHPSSSNADTSSRTGTREPHDGNSQDTQITVPRTKGIIVIFFLNPVGKNRNSAQWHWSIAHSVPDREP